MSEGVVRLDVAFTPNLYGGVRNQGAQVVIIIDALYAGPLVASALNAGYGSVRTYPGEPHPDVMISDGPAALFDETREGDGSVDAYDLWTAISVVRATSDDLQKVVLACLPNLRVVAAQVGSFVEPGMAISIVCAGEGANFDAGDAAVAGALVTLLLQEVPHDIEMSDAAGAALSLCGTYGDAYGTFMGTAAGRRMLAEFPERQRDIAYSAQADIIPRVPTLGDVPRLEAADPQVDDVAYDTWY